MPSGVLVSCFAILLLMSCAGPPPRTPASAARDRVMYLQRHGGQLSPEQVAMLRRLPYGDPRTTRRRMENIRRNPDADDELRELQRGRRVSVRSLVKTDDEDPSDGGSPGDGEEESP